MSKTITPPEKAQPLGEDGLARAINEFTETDTIKVHPRDAAIHAADIAIAVNFADGIKAEIIGAKMMLVAAAAHVYDRYRIISEENAGMFLKAVDVLNPEFYDALKHHELVHPYVNG